MGNRVAETIERELVKLGAGAAFERIDADYGGGLGDLADLQELAVIATRNASANFVWRLMTLPLGSPLEALFYCAVRIYVNAALTPDSASFLDHRCDSMLEGDLHHRAPKGVPSGWETLAVCCQHHLGPYRLDFLLTAYSGLEIVNSVAVEVDGHDFHERTKEQARHDRRKDRAVQAQGLKILRFTGSEVHGGPLGCAAEAVNAAFGSDISAWMHE